MYKVEYDKDAEKALEIIQEPYYSAIKKAIKELETNPRPNVYIKLANSELYRIRKGPFRILYNIQDKRLIILILEIGQRQSVYNKK